MYEIEKIKGEKIAIHVPTKELAREVMDILVKSGGQDLMRMKDSSRDRWKEYESETCWIHDSHTMFCNRDWLKSNGYEIISAEEFLEDNKETTAYRDGNLELVTWLRVRYTVSQRMMVRSGSLYSIRRVMIGNL